MNHRHRPPIERASSADLLALASDLPDSPAVVGAIILLGPGGAELSSTRSAIADRIRTIPRLRQRLRPTPFGGGRKAWIDDYHFDVGDHVQAMTCPPPGDWAALLDVAADCVTRRLPADRPLWSALLVRGLAEDRTALIFVFHHVLADGIGGLAILSRLVDGAPPAAIIDFPRRAPSPRDLFGEAFRARWGALSRTRPAVRRLGSAARELTPNGVARAPRTSLNRPTGASRRLVTVQADLGAVQRVAHEHGATVNDVALTAVTGALHTLLRHRGERVDQVVVSVPVSSRRAATATGLGNEVGAIPIRLPCTGDPQQRLAMIARATHDAKTTAPGSSAALLGPAFRSLAGLGVLRWFLDRQRLITTFVTNVRGPADRLRFLGAPVVEIIPVSPITGNVTVAFAALSYAGTLTITVVADPQRCPDLPLLRTALQRELDVLAEGGVRAAS